MILAVGLNRYSPLQLTVDSSAGIAGDCTLGVYYVLQLSQIDVQTFNQQFEMASAAARKWVVPDAGLKATLRDAIGDQVVPVYREWLGHPAVATLAFGT